MASGAEPAELPGHSSQVKRRKVVRDAYSSTSVAKFETSIEDQSNSNYETDLEGSVGENNRFLELSDGFQSTSTTSDLTNSSSTPTRTDSMSDDTGYPLDASDEKDDVSSTVSNLSDLSGISMLSDDDESNGQWRSATNWVQKQIQSGIDPRHVLRQLFSDPSQIPAQVDDFTLWKIVINMMAEPPKREKLSHVNSFNDVVKLIKESKRIIVLTGAGVSVSCGIPDFRSRDGIYARLAQDFPDLPDPQAMFDINYFGQDPRPFFKFAREIYPGQFKPSACHEFIKILDKQKKLLRNYSQNIDTLERVAGIKNVIECHGSFATASCTRCKYQVKADDIKEDIFTQKIPMCPKCKKNTLPSIVELSPNENYNDLVSQGIMKPDIVFFGEGLPDAFHDAMAVDKDMCDLLIVIGSSLKVRPVALIPSSIPAHVPQILINRESLPHLEFDIELLGDGDVIINQLCHMLGGCYKKVCWKDVILDEASSLLAHHIPLNGNWDQSQSTITSHELSQDSNPHDVHDILSRHDFMKNSPPCKTEEIDENCPLDDRPWKKMYNSNDPVFRELFGDEPISSITESRFYSTLVEHFENDKNSRNKDTMNVTCFEKKDSSADDVKREHRKSTEKTGLTNKKDTCKNNEESLSTCNVNDIRENDRLVDRPWKNNCTTDPECKESIGENSSSVLALEVPSSVIDYCERKRIRTEETSEAAGSSVLENQVVNMELQTSPFHTDHMESVENFVLLHESPKRRQDDSSIENSPKRRNYGSDRGDSSEKSQLMASPLPVDSLNAGLESTSRGDIFNSEECHVVPRMDYLRDDPTLESSESSDKMETKPRHTSIDSVMDSALGDSCSSIDCQKRKTEVESTEENKKFHKLNSQSWQEIDRDSLASRLPENSYYQMKPGKYIFPGAEVYATFAWSDGLLQLEELRSH